MNDKCSVDSEERFETQLNTCQECVKPSRAHTKNEEEKQQIEDLWTCRMFILCLFSDDLLFMFALKMRMNFGALKFMKINNSLFLEMPNPRMRCCESSRIFHEYFALLSY